MKILKHAVDVQFLLTSREHLNIKDEWVYDITGLTYTSETDSADGLHVDAVQLFIQSARRVNQHFSLSPQHSSDILHICRLVAGMPLAIEIAASWSKLLSCQDIAKEIEASFDFLSSSHSDRKHRHQSIRIVFESTWKRLTPLEQNILARLSLFQGDFVYHAAEVIAAASLPQLANLTDCSLLQCTGGRFVIHPLMKQFLCEKLYENNPEYQQTVIRFCQFYAHFLEEREQHLKTGRQREAMQDIRAELPNIRYAWNWACQQHQARILQKMMPGLALFYEMHSRFQEAKEVFQDAVHHFSLSLDNDDLTMVVLAQLTIQYAVFARNLVYDKDISPLYHHILPVLKSRNNPELAHAYIQAGWMISWLPMKTPEVKAWLTAGETLAMDRGDEWEQAFALFGPGRFSLVWPI